MNMTKSVLILVAVIIIGSFAIFSITRNQTPAAVSDSLVYCGSDGSLSNTKSIQSHRSYCIKSNAQTSTFTMNTPSSYSFSIVDDQGNILKDFQITHTKLLHLIVVRKDLAYFQHVHPDFDQTTGTFTLKDLTFPADGQYRIFADFAPVGAQIDAMGTPLAVTPFEDASVGNTANYVAQSIGSGEKTKTFGDLTVALATQSAPTSGAEGMLTFSLSQNGKPVTDLQTYLGALGHAVILREGNLDFIHAHPVEAATSPQSGKVNFMVDFPEAGKYKVFTQFQRGGKVITTDFVVTVTQAVNPPAPAMNHGSMQMNQ